MTAHSYTTLGDVVVDPMFAAVDASLRQGRHIDVAQPDAYSYLVDAQALLEPFYRRYGCDLVLSPNGYFYLRPSESGLIRRRQLSAGAMLAGQALALLYLDPAVSVQRTGVVTRAQLTGLLESLVGVERLVVALNPRVRRHTATVDHERVRRELDRSLRSLAALGFVELQGDDDLVLRAPLLRFTDVVRGAADLGDSLRRLVDQGEVVLAPSEGDDDAELEIDALEGDDTP